MAKPLFFRGLSLITLMGLAVALPGHAKDKLRLDGPKPPDRHLVGATPGRSAAAPRPGMLASGEVRLVGLRLELPATHADVPVSTPFVVKPTLKLGNRETTPAERAQFVPAGAMLEGVLSGPGLTPATVRGTLETGLSIQGLSQAGDGYAVSNVKLVHQGRTLVEAGSLSITCLGELLVSSVTATPITSMEEMRQAGIQLGAGAYEAKKFKIALVMGSRSVNLTIPIARPVHNGLLNPRGDGSIVGRLELKDAFEADVAVPDLGVHVVDILPEPTFTLSRPEVRPLLEQSFKSVVVIPVSIKFLKNFFKVNLLVLNVLQEGAPYVVRGLKAEALLPPGADGSRGTDDDPLKLVSGEGVTAATIKPIYGHDALGKPSEAETVVKAGQSGSAQWLVKGDREGCHLLQFRIQGEFSGGLLTGPIPIQGMARGKVMVQNPTFNLLLVHPEVVRRNEVYTLEARLTNTSDKPALDVSINLDMARLAGVTLADEKETASRNVKEIPPHGEVVFTWRLKAMRNGEVVGTYQALEGLTGGFSLGMALGERSIRLSPDTLVLPQTLSSLPEYLREAILRVLGQAHSIATSKSALPPGVLPIDTATITSRLAASLNEAGLFLRMGVARNRVLLDLWAAFTRNSDGGFDQLMRTTEAGHQLRSAFLRLLQEWSAPGTAQDALQELAPAVMAQGGSALALFDTTAPGLVVGARCEDGAQLVGGGVLPLLGPAGAALAVQGHSQLIQVPQGHGSVTLWARNEGTSDLEVTLQCLAAQAAAGVPPTLNQYLVRIPRGATAFLNLGEGRGPSVRLDSGGQALPNTTLDVLEEPFRVLAVHRYDLGLDPSASPYGTQVLVLFNKANTPLALPSGDAGYTRGNTVVSVQGNTLWRKVMAPNPKDGTKPEAPPAVVQMTPRIVSIYLEKPVGPNETRTLTLSDGSDDRWTSIAGQSLGEPRRWPIACSTVPGGAKVKGKVRKATGETISGLGCTYSYYYFTSMVEGGVDLQTGYTFLDMEADYYALITNAMPIGQDGDYEIDFAPEPTKTALGPLFIIATTPLGQAWGQATVLGPNTTIEMDLVLEGKGDVFGTITDGAGRPLEGATVEANQEQVTPGLMGSTSGVMQASAQTDKDGKYAIKGLKTGVFSLRVLHGLLGAARSGVIARDGDKVQQDIKLEGATLTLKAKVLNPDGSPRVGQPVYLGIPAGLLRSGNQVNFIYPYALDTDAEGSVTFTRVPAGDLSVKTPGRDGFHPVWFGYEATAGATVQVTLRYPEGDLRKTTVTTTVVDSNGDPVAKATVYWDQQQSIYPAGHTDSLGQVTLPAPIGKPYSVTITHVDWPQSGTQSSALVPTAEGPNTLRVTLPARSWLQGRVTYPNGQPAAGTYVVVPPVWPRPSKNRLTQTDAKGFYKLPGLSLTEGSRVVFLSYDTKVAETRTVQGKAEEGVTLDVVMPFPGANVLWGKTLQPDGVGAMASWQVYGYLPNISSGDEDGGNSLFGTPMEVLVDRGKSGLDGAYRTLEPLPNGPYRLVAWNDLFPTRAQVNGYFDGPAETKQRNITLVSTFAGALEGRIYRPDGVTRVGKGVRVSVVGGSLGTEGVMVHTGADGSYKFDKVIPAGKYSMVVEDPTAEGLTSHPEWGKRAIEEVTLEEEINRFRTVRLLGKGTLTVRLQDAQGLPLESGNVTLRHNRLEAIGSVYFPPMVGTADATNKGVLPFEGLWEGHVTLELKAGALRGSASVEMPQGGGNAEVVVRLQPTGGVIGLLKGADGSPVNSGRVDIYLYGRWYGVSHTPVDNVKGRFRFQGLPAGLATLEAFDPYSRQVGKVTVLIPENGEAVTEILCLDKGAVDVSVTQEGTSISRATVLLRYLGGPANIVQAEATTKADGKASFTLPPGDWSVEATDPVTLATGSARFTRSNNQGPISVDVRLAALRTLNVTVIPPPGFSGSMEGWRLRSDNGRTVAVRADHKVLLPDMMAGRFRIHLADTLGRYRGQRDAVLTVEGNDTQYVQLKALARGDVEVELKDDKGAPVTLGNITLSPSDGQYGAFPTDLQGKVRFKDQLQGWHNAYGRDRVTGLSVYGDVQVEQEGSTASLSMVLGSTGRLQGLLRDAQGVAVPFNAVALTTPGGYGGRTLGTDAEGRFHAEDLPLGTYRVSASLEGRNRSGSRTVVLSQADALVDASFSLSSAGVLKGKVQDPLRPIGEVDVLVTGPQGYQNRMTVESDGVYRLRDLPAGPTLTLTALMEDGITSAGSQMFQIPAEGELTLDLTLEPRPSLEGRTLEWLKDTTGMAYEAHKSMVVRLNDATTGQEVRRFATSEGHPRFRMNYLVPGVLYRINGYDLQGLVAQSSLTLNATTETQTFDLYAMPTRTLHVRVLKGDGTVFQGNGRIDVVSRRAGGGTWSAPMTAGQGDVPGVVTGPVIVRVSGLANQPVLESPELQVVQGETTFDVDLFALEYGSLRTTVRTQSGRLLQGTRILAKAQGSPTWEG